MTHEIFVYGLQQVNLTMGPPAPFETQSEKIRHRHQSKLYRIVNARMEL